MSSPRHSLSPVLALTLLAACSLRGGSSEAEPPVTDPATLRQTGSGAVLGYTPAAGTHAWLGVPFAEPPAGELRWRAPRPADAWAGVRESIAPGPACAQYANPLSSEPDAPEGSVTGSEDCLYLNVYAPAATPEVAAARRLPVMVWIHGGGNTTGYAAAYDGGPMARRHDVVVVTTNYRLGPLGWFRHPALAADSDDLDDASGNWGTLDLIRSLEWVQENIASFGGDPDNVTIFGESAGGADVYTLLLSPRAEGLFHRAISQSGGTRSVSIAEAQNAIDAPEPGHANSSAEVALRLLAPEASDRQAARAEVARLSDEEIGRGLRAASLEQVFEAFPAEEGRSMGSVNVPSLIRDGHVLPLEKADALFASGEYNQVPFLVGSNRDEMRLFLLINPEYTRWWLGFLPAARDPDLYQAVAYHESRAWKFRGVDRPASLMSEVQGPTVYAYRFDWDEAPSVLGLIDLSELLGAFHGLELAFLFPGLEIRGMARIFDEDNRAGREKLSDAMMSYWAEFAYTGSPGRGRDGSLPEWSAWNPEPGEPKYIVLDNPDTAGIRMERDPITDEELLGELTGDPRLLGSQRCRLLASLNRRETWVQRQDPIGCATDVAGGGSAP